MSELNIAEDEIEEGAYVEWTTSGGMIDDDTECAGIVKEVVTEYNHALDAEQTFVVLDDGNEESRVNIKHFESESDSVKVTAYQPQSNNDDGDDEDDEPELVTDGGEDQSAHIRDAEIEAAIEQHDDPDHPDALSVDGVRELLTVVQRDVEEGWGQYMDQIEDGSTEVVADDGDVVVLSTGEFRTYDEILDRVGSELTDVEYDDVASDVVSDAIHNAAERLTDYGWGGSYPLVVRKPDVQGDGQRYVEAIVNGLMREGLSPGQAWAVYGVHVAGHSRNKWAARCGYSDHSAISEPLRKAEKKAGHLGLID